MRLAARTILASILTVLIGIPLGAHAESNEALLQRIERLEKLVAELQAKLDERHPSDATAQPTTTVTDRDTQRDEPKTVVTKIGTDRSETHPSRSRNKLYGLKHFPVDVHGFVDLTYNDPGSDGDPSTFDLHHANIFFDTQVRENLRAHLELEYEHTDEVEIDQAYFELGATDWLTLSAGRFYAPFGIERFSWYPPVNSLISRPLPFRKIIPGNFYQQGVKAAGNIPLNDTWRLTYEASLSNGLGASAVNDRRGSRQSRDNNDELAYTGRLAVVFWPWAEVGASGHAQRFSDRHAENQDLLFLGLDAAARWQGFELRAEWVDADLDRIGMKNLEQDGWYTQLSYTQHFRGREWPKSLTYVTRFDKIDLNIAPAGSDNKERWSIGANMQIYDHLRLKVEYQFNSEDGPRVDDDEFLAQAVFDF